MFQQKREIARAVERNDTAGHGRIRLIIDVKFVSALRFFVVVDNIPRDRVVQREGTVGLNVQSLQLGGNVFLPVNGLQCRFDGGRSLQNGGETVGGIIRFIVILILVGFGVFVKRGFVVNRNAATDDGAGVNTAHARFLIDEQDATDHFARCRIRVQRIRAVGFRVVPARNDERRTRSRADDNRRCIDDVIDGCALGSRRRQACVARGGYGIFRRCAATYGESAVEVRLKIANLLIFGNDERCRR